MVSQREGLCVADPKTFLTTSVQPSGQHNVERPLNTLGCLAFESNMYRCLRHMISACSSCSFIYVNFNHISMIDCSNKRY